MTALLLLAAKSLLIGAGGVLILKLMRGRSASDRSLIAHFTLGALLLLPLWAFVLPGFEVSSQAFAPLETTDMRVLEVGRGFAVPTLEAPSSAPADWEVALFDWAIWIYAVPAALLVALTILALVRLAILKARAEVLLDPFWLRAFVRLQQTMRLRDGSALLSSAELRSPISWGVMRPVIVLDAGTIEARGNAEAIIAHELAHILHWDWLKLILARVAVSLFWFNPLVWLIAREAHQLREEAADDMVLIHVENTDYASLLVDSARHARSCPLQVTHAIAPGRSSLKRRVERVLDEALDRAPSGWRWTCSIAFVVLGLAAPLAAMEFIGSSPVGGSPDGPRPAAGSSFLESTVPTRTPPRRPVIPDRRRAADVDYPSAAPLSANERRQSIVSGDGLPNPSSAQMQTPETVDRTEFEAEFEPELEWEFEPEFELEIEIEAD